MMGQMRVTSLRMSRSAFVIIVCWLWAVGAEAFSAPPLPPTVKARIRAIAGCSYTAKSSHVSETSNLKACIRLGGVKELARATEEHADLIGQLYGLPPRLHELFCAGPATIHLCC